MRLRFRTGLAVVVAVGALSYGVFLWVAVPIRAQSTASITLETIVSGLASPDFVTHAGDSSGRLFIVEQEGRIRIFENGGLRSTPFLDITSRVTSGGERGLLSVAFHPGFRTNGRFFVNYTNNRPTLKTFVAEYHTSPSDPNVADAAERVLLEIDQPFENHNGGSCSLAQTVICTSAWVTAARLAIRGTTHRI